MCAGFLMPVISSIVLYDRPQRETKRHVKYRVVLMDNQGNEHTHTTRTVVLPYNSVAADQVAAMGALVLEQVTAQEEQAAITAIRKGLNPFRDGDAEVEPQYWTRNVLIAVCLIHYLSIPNPAEVMHLVPLLDNLTDAELMGLLSIAQDKVDEIRATAEKLAAVAGNVVGYVPPLGDAA